MHINYTEWLNDKNKYYELVWRITELNKHNIKGIEKRGKGYCIDHIIPIILGFQYSIIPSIIGGKDNLQILSNKENFIKNSLITAQCSELLKAKSINLNELYKIKMMRAPKYSVDINPLKNTNKKSLLYYEPFIYPDYAC